MSKTYTDIPVTAVDGRSPVTEGLLTKFHDNGEALISGPVDTKFVETSDIGPTTVAFIPIFIPPGVTTSVSTISFLVHLEARVTTGDTGQVRVRLAGGTWTAWSGFTNDTYSAHEFAVLSADVVAAADSLIDLEVEVERTAGGAGPVFARCLSAASRIEAS